MKSKVLKFLKNLPTKKEDQFNEAFNLLRNVPDINFQQIRSYNISGATESNIRNIIYDLKKSYNISDAEIQSKRNSASEIKDLLKEQELITSEQSVQIDIIPKEGINPDAEKDTKSNLRNRFPFLNDLDCPVELHIITGQLISSWKRYNVLLEKVQEIDAGTLLVEEVENLKITEECNSEFENNNALMEELQYYKENKKLLCAHKSLKEYQIKKEVDLMSQEELIKFRTNAASNKSKDKTKLENAKDEKTAEKIRLRMSNLEMRLDLVNKKLGMNG